MTSELRPETRERILDGAMEAVALHGLKKLGMADISESAGVSRGTVYRYFANRDELLLALVEHERRRFGRGLNAALDEVDGGAEPLRAMLDYIDAYLREQPALQRLLETEPHFVLRYMRDQFPFLRSAVAQVLEPAVSALPGGRLGSVRVEVLADWVLRILVSWFLIPEPVGNEPLAGLDELYDILVAQISRPRS